MKFVSKSALIALLMAAAAATQAAAQAPEQRVTVNFTPAFATVGGDTETALAGSLGYRFTEHLSFEGDFTWIDAAAGGVRDRQFAFGSAQLTTGVVNDILRGTQGMFGGGNNNRGDGRLPSFTGRGLPNILPVGPIGIGNFNGSTDGQTMIGTLGLRYEPTVQTARFRPYVSGGIGMNYTDQELTLAAASATTTTTTGNAASTGAFTVPGFDESVSHSGFALSAGGGANIRLFSSVWANADAKYFRLSRDRNIMRLGGGIGVRF